MTNLLDTPFPPELKDIWTKDFAIQLAGASAALSGLNQAVPLLQNPNLLMRSLLGKEAESSSRLEGTQASMEDVYRSELVVDPEKRDDITEIVNYQNAMVRGQEVIKTRPLNQSVIRQIHKTLMAGVRGETKSPGKFRTGDVWIGKQGTGVGDARYVPPGAIHVQALMDELDKFVLNPNLPALVASGVIHHRFEAIHPFMDGNGRTGRLLITLYLLKMGELSAPMLYPSGFFDKNRDEYIDALHSVDVDQNWYDWLMYYLRAIETQARLSLHVARDMDTLYKKCREQIEGEAKYLGLLKVLDFAFKQPYLTVALAKVRTGLPLNTTRRYLETLEAKGVIMQIDTMARGQKVYANLGLLDILRQI